MPQEFVNANRGYGEWQFEIYNPNKVLGPFNGYLFITKEHHVIFEDEDLLNTIVNIPSHNVSWVIRVKK
jgi:hypothetical protein